MAQEKILVVDDNIAQAAMLKSRLEAAGFLVDSARTGEEALEILRTEWVDLIVMEIVFKKGLNGFQLLEKIKKKKDFMQIPVVIQSGKAIMKKAFEYMGIEAFFIKPYSVDVLLEEVKDILTKKILIVGKEDKTTASITKDLSRYDFQIDTVRSINKFYINILSFRYCLVAMQHKIRSETADKMITLIRRSKKNESVPIIIYTSSKISEMSPRETREVKAMKERCDALGGCEFMDKGYFHRRFIDLSKKYLESF